MEKQESVLEDGYSYEIKFIVPPEEYVAKANEELHKLKKKISIPGFRPGRVPFHLVRKLVGEEFLYDTILKIVEYELNKVLKEKGDSLIEGPLIKNVRLDGVSWQEGHPAEVSFLIAIKPEVQLPESLDEPVTFSDIVISDKYIDEYLDHFAIKHGSYKEVDDPDEAQYFILLLHLDGYEIPFFVERSQITEDLLKKLVEESEQPVDAKLGEDILIDKEEFWKDVLQYVKEHEKNNNLLKLVNSHKNSSDLKVSLAYMEVFEPREIDLDAFKEMLLPRYAKKVKDEAQAREFLKEQLKYELLHLAYRQVLLDLLDKLKDMLEVPVPEEYLLQRAIRKVKEESDLDVDDEIVDEEIELEADRLEDRLITDLIVDALLKKFDIKVSSGDIEEALAKHLYFKFSESEEKEPPKEELEDLKKSAGEIIKMGLEREDLWYERVFLEKIVNALLEAGWVQKKPVPIEEFVK